MRPLHCAARLLLVAIAASTLSVDAQSPVQSCNATPVPAWCSAVDGDRSQGWARQHRSEVMARNGMVATSQPLAAQVGLDILKRGGNAVDAAVAISAVLNLVEPMNVGVGGDLFAIVYIAKENKLYTLNASGKAPSGQTLARMNSLGYSWNARNWGPGSGMPPGGILTVTVPGTVWGWDEVLHRFGTMTFKETLQPAIDYAENGFPVSERIANDWHLPRALGPVPGDGRDFDRVGRRRCRHHCDRAPGPGRRGGKVRPAMSDFVIEAEGLTKRYNGAAAVDHVSFNVSRGEIFGLLGPNGAGKTTTILMLLGLTDLTEGKARVLGHDPEREPLAVKRRVGYLPDSVGFYDHMTAAENLRYTARLMGMREAEREDRMAAALRRVELTEVADNRVATFSRGMRQRLGLAEILMKEAAVAILDEPTSGLDPQATLELLDMIRALKREGVSVLLSSHLLDRVQSVCDRVALFQAGKIVLIGTVAELGRQVLGGGFAVEVEAQGSGLAERLSEVPGVTAVEQRGPDRVRLLADRDVRPQAAAAVVAAGGQLLRLSVEEPSLEMIYTRYFQEHGAQHAA